MAKPTIQPSIERGMRDFLPEVMRRRNWCMQQLRAVFESFGFEPLETPAVESLAVLMGKYGEEGDRLIFKLAKGEGKESALRYDLTVPLARVVAMHQNAIALPWKRYHIAPVWRAERPQRGRFREFLQCDIDTVGAPAPVADAEVICVAAAAYKAVIPREVKIRVNHRGLVTALCERAGFGPDDPRAGFLLRVVDKEDRLGVDGVCEALAAGEAREGRDPIGIEPAVVGLVRALFETRGADDVIGAVRDLCGDAPSAPHAASELRAVMRAVEESGGAPNAVVDPALMRGLDYYTGPVFEVTCPGAEMGSIGGGGRYDGLIGTMLGREIPAVGFSVGLERLLVLLAEDEAGSEALNRASNLVIAIFSDEFVGASLKLAAEVRGAIPLLQRERNRSNAPGDQPWNEQYGVEVFPGKPGKMGKQFAWAAKRRAEYVAVVGPDEAATDSVTVKDLSSGEQHSVPRPKLPEWIVDRL